MDSRFLTTLEQIVDPTFVRSSIRERKCYSVDIGEMPKLVKPFVNAGIAGAVVRPQTQEQLIDIIKEAQKAHVSIVPRGLSTSGYGGALPRKDALVVDMSDWREILSMDKQACTVTCQAGVVWEELDAVLKEEGLELRTHPSSYPSSTVGGWLAQGGSGFGAFEYGSFQENVLSATVVDPRGEVRIFEGDDVLALVAEAEGITGVICDVTFKVRVAEEQKVKLIAAPHTASAGQLFSALYTHQLPLWSVSFFNPESVRLKKRLPGRNCHSFEKEAVEAARAAEMALPEKYLILCAYPAARASEVDDILQKIVADCGAEFLSDEAAMHEWNARTSPMRLKRLGPSIIPTEVIVPVDEIAGMLDDIDANIDQEFVLEGMLCANKTAVFLGYIPHDERQFSFNFAFALALSVIKMANARGGSGYGTGLYFRREAQSILGPEKVERLRAYKRDFDPQGILNPGKVIAIPGQGGGALDSLMGLAMNLEGVIRGIANGAKAKNIGAGPARNNIDSNVASAATMCSRCGYCVTTCEQYSVRGWESDSPRGKYTWLREVYAGREKWDRSATETFLLCTTCERCDLRCQLQLPVSHNGMAMRKPLVKDAKQGTFPPFEMMAAALDSEGDIWAGKRENRANWLPADVAERLVTEDADVLYFAGCTSSYVETDIAEATIRLLLDSGLKVAYLGTEENCCGIPMKMAGRWDLFEKVFKANTAAVTALGTKTVVTSCPACALVWKEMYAQEAQRLGVPYDIEVKQYSEIIGPAIADGTIQLKTNVFEGKTVAFHDSCHAGRAMGVYEPPRQMLQGIPDINLVEFKNNREDAVCCGSVATLVGEIEVAPKLGCARLDEAVEAGADTIVALCPCCQVQLRDSVDKGGFNLEVSDLARVVANAAGYDIAPSDDYQKYMWSYFERFIILMKPEQMAQFMTRLFPQMLDAMPAGMGGMMRAMGKTTAGNAMIKKMMPAMFPMMAPGILGKVMPEMVAEVQDFIGEMPPDMDELIPDLLPKCMDQMMPSYLPQLIPHLVPLFADYLKNGGKDNGPDGGTRASVDDAAGTVSESAA